MFVVEVKIKDYFICDVVTRTNDDFRYGSGAFNLSCDLI